MLYFSTNIEATNMDIDSGAMRAGWPRTYQITWSLFGRDDLSKIIIIITTVKGDRKNNIFS